MEEKQMKRIVSLIMVFSVVFCACGKKENGETVSNSGSGVAVGNTVTESAVSGGATGEENGSEPSPNMTVTMAKKDGPMLTEQVDQTQKGIEMVNDHDFATCLTKGDDGSIYYFRYQKRKKGGKLTFYKNNAIKVCETVLSEEYEKDGYYIAGFLKQGEEFWVKFTSYKDEELKHILLPVRIKDGKLGSSIKTNLNRRIIFYKDCFYFCSEDENMVDIIDRDGNKKTLDFENRRASLQMIIDDKLYYIIEKGIKGGGSEYTVKRCDMDGSNKEELFRYSRVPSTNGETCKLRMDGDFLYLFDPYLGFTLTQIPLYGGEVKKIAAVDWYDLSEYSIYYLDREGKISRVGKDLKGTPEVVMSRSEWGDIPFRYADGHLMVEDYNQEEIDKLYTIFELEDFDLICDIRMNYSNIYHWVAENGEVEDTIPSSGFREEYDEWYERALPIVEKNSDEWD